VTESLRIEKLRREHNVDPFDCGQEPLNRFLVRFALQNQQAEASQTYVAMAGDAVVRFYTLAVAQVEDNDAPVRLAKGLARHPIPLMLLARLAIAKGWQGQRARRRADERRHAADAPGRRDCRHTRHRCACEGRCRQVVLRTLRFHRVAD
jgi:hypothetical protein